MTSLRAFVQDLRFAIRLLGRSPAVAATAVLTLGVGIGSSTTIFSAMNAVVLNAMPWREPGRIVQIFQRYRPQPNMDRMSVSPANYLDWRDAQSVDEMAAYRHLNLNLGGHEGPERVRGVEATARLFEVLGVAPAIGRTFASDSDADETTGTPEPVIVLGHALWERRFGADPAVVGRNITVNGRGVTVVGVMPRTFRFPIGWLTADVDAWMRLDYSPAEAVNRQDTSLSVIARVGTGHTLDQVRTELDLVARRLEDAHPATNQDWGTTVMPIADRVASGLGRVVSFLSIAVAGILIIACANVANLLLARGLDRQAELTVRSALGAGRGRLARQLFTEGLVLSAAGGAFGVALAFWAVATIRAMAPAGDLRDLGALRVDAGALLFSAALAIIVGIVFSVIPALTLSRVSLRGSLETGRAGDALVRTRVKSALVAAELAVAVVLLVCASALLSSFQSYMAVDPGYDAAGAVTMRLSLPEERYPSPGQQADFFDALQSVAHAVPGVTAVAFGTSAPGDGGGAVFRYRVPGRPATDPAERRIFAEYQGVTPDYWRAAGIPVIRGRVFSPADREGTGRVAVVNDAFVRREFGETNPLGAQILLEGDVNRSATAGPPSAPLEIVGVVGDTKHYGLQYVTPPMIYVPMRQDPKRTMALVVRTTGEPTAVVPAIRAGLAQLDRDQPIYNVKTLEAVLAESHALFSLNTIVLGAFGAAAWVLSLVGVYGVFRTMVAQRRREFGLRIALGARPYHVASLVLGRALRLSLAGIAIGTAVSWPALVTLAGAVKTAMNVDLTVGWAGTAGIVAAGMLVASTLACLIPARRAWRIDPLEAWREG